MSLNTISLIYIFTIFIPSDSSIDEIIQTRRHLQHEGHNIFLYDKKILKEINYFDVYLKDERI